MIIYSFFKNIALVFVIFFFQADNGWSGSSLYNQWVYSGYNFFVGLLPFYMGFFGLDTVHKSNRRGASHPFHWLICAQV